MKKEDTYKTTTTHTAYTVKAFGFEITIPAGSEVDNSTAVGNNDLYHFWINWGDNDMVKEFPFLKHDLTFQGINIPAEYCNPYSD